MLMSPSVIAAAGVVSGFSVETVTGLCSARFLLVSGCSLNLLIANSLILIQRLGEPVNSSTNSSVAVYRRYCAWISNPSTETMFVSYSPISFQVLPSADHSNRPFLK